MTPWDQLRQELDAWGDAGRQASLWWRDDDAVEPTAALNRLLGLAEDSKTALALAVIPARCGHALPKRLERALASVLVLQHGYGHHNHAAADEKKIELGSHRPAPEILEELARGSVRIQAAFGSRALPVLVPPWNRIDPGLFADLPALGLRGLSSHGPRASAIPVKGLWQTNTHVDIMRWKEPRGFLGEEVVLRQIRDHLHARRMEPGGPSVVDPVEPTGLLTHHLAHDEAAWAFLSRLLPLLAGHPACRFIDAAEAFPLSQSESAGGPA